MKPLQRPLLPRTQTYSVFDDTTVIKCAEGSPFVSCNGRPLERTPEEKAADAARHRPWKIANIKKAAWHAPLGFDKCRYSNCVSVPTPGPDTDVIHVYGVGLNSNFPRPKRYPNQMWAFSVHESPHHTHADLLNSEFGGFSFSDSMHSLSRYHFLLRSNYVTSRIGTQLGILSSSD